VGEPLPSQLGNKNSLLPRVSPTIPNDVPIAVQQGNPSNAAAVAASAAAAIKPHEGKCIL